MKKCINIFDVYQLNDAIDNRIVNINALSRPLPDNLLDSLKSLLETKKIIDDLLIEIYDKGYKLCLILE